MKNNLLNTILIFEPFNRTHQVTKLTEDTFIINFFDTEPKTGWEGTGKNVQIEKERRPCCRLMFRHRCNNRNVDLCITGVPERVKSSTPWCNYAWNKMESFFHLLVQSMTSYPRIALDFTALIHYTTSIIAIQPPLCTCICQHNNCKEHKSSRSTDSKEEKWLELFLRHLWFDVFKKAVGLQQCKNSCKK